MSHVLLRGDHHVHSTFSDDAVSTLAQNVEAAASAGLSTLRLVDHVRRSTTWVPEYLAAVRALRVPDGLTVLTGVEAKILDVAGRTRCAAASGRIDRILMADHQFPGVDGPLGPSAVRERIAAGWATDDVLDQFVEALIATMRRYPGNQLAHLLLYPPEDRAVGGRRGRRADVMPGARAAAETDTLVEVNEKWGCPGAGALAALRRAGATIVASTDSHDASEVGRYSRILPLLDAEEAS